MATEATAKQVEPENDTTIIGAIPLQGTEIVHCGACCSLEQIIRLRAPTVGDSQFTQAELQAGLATLTPVAGVLGLRWKPVPVWRVRILRYTTAGAEGSQMCHYW